MLLLAYLHDFELKNNKNFLVLLKNRQKMSLLAFQRLLTRTSYNYSKLGRIHDEFQKDPVFQRCIEESPKTYEHLLLRRAINSVDRNIFSELIVSAVCVGGAFAFGDSEPGALATYSGIFCLNNYLMYGRFKDRRELVSIREEIDK